MHVKSKPILLDIHKLVQIHCKKAIEALGITTTYCARRMKLVRLVDYYGEFWVFSESTLQQKFNTPAKRLYPGVD
jgi:hypothetical protein